jgi:hypothetical protein
MKKCLFFVILAASAIFFTFLAAACSASGGSGGGDDNNDDQDKAGAAWTMATSTLAGAGAVSGISYSGGTLYAYGTSGKYSTSTNGGAAWSAPVTIDDFTGTGVIRGMAANGSNILAVGTTGSDNMIIAADTPPSEWTALEEIRAAFDTDFTAFNTVIYDGTNFFAAGQRFCYATGTDTSSWECIEVQDATDADNITSATINTANKVVFTLQGGRVSSVDISSGEDPSSPVEAISSIANGIAFGGGIYVVVGESGKIATSTDIATWEYAATAGFGGRDNIKAVAFGNSKFVAVAKGKIAYSSDGITWTLEAAPAFSASDEIVGITFDSAAKRFVAVSDGGKIAYSKVDY